MAYNLMQLHSTLCSGGLSFAGSLVLIHLMFWLSPSSGTCLCDPELVLPPLRSGAAASVCVLSCRVIWVSPEGCSLLSGSSGIPGLPCSEPSSDVYIPWVYIGRTFGLGWRCFAGRGSVQPFAGLFIASQLMSPYALHMLVSFLSRSSPQIILRLVLMTGSEGFSSVWACAGAREILEVVGLLTVWPKSYRLDDFSCLPIWTVAIRELIPK